MNRWAIYRIHYGLDFLKHSIDSIVDSVDHVHVIYSLDPWVVKDTVHYLGEDVPMPKLHEDVNKFMNDHYSNDYNDNHHRNNNWLYACELLSL